MTFVGGFNDFCGWDRTSQDLKARNFRWNPAEHTIASKAKKKTPPLTSQVQTAITNICLNCITFNKLNVSYVTTYIISSPYNELYCLTLNLSATKKIITSDDICCSIRNVKFIKVMPFKQMFVTAVCVLFLLKLKWPKSKNFYVASALTPDLL